uniref:Uncharacterized protein n=2 Tax=Clytia hemisphaerica TaxID=252671 RepID=A0A7M5VE63_9CNID
YDSDVEAPEEELHEFSQFENHEVDPSLFEGIDFNENIFQGFDEPNSDLEIVPLTVKFVSDESIKQVKESDQSTEQDSSKTVYICPKCSKKYTRHYHFENHVNKLCTAGKSSSKSGLGSGLDDQSQNKGFLKTTLDNLKHLDITNEVLTSIKDDPMNNLKVGDKLSPGNLVDNFAAKLLQSKQSNAKNFEAASRTW